MEKLQTTKKNQDKYISELAEKLAHVQNDIANKEQSLLDLEKTHKDLVNDLEEEKRQKLSLEEECTLLKSNYEVKMINFFCCCLSKHIFNL